jgi:hypothetical protein
MGKSMSGATKTKNKRKKPVTAHGCDKAIFIRCTREGKDAYEAVYKATLSEWTRLTGQTEDETFLAFDCGQIKDDKLFDDICCREEQDVRLSELEDIPFVIICY